MKAKTNGRANGQRAGAILVKLSALEMVTVQHAAQLAGDRPTTWARQELVRRANALIRRAARLKTTGAM